MTKEKSNKSNNALITIPADSTDIENLYELPDIFSLLLNKKLLKFTQAKLFLFPFFVPIEHLEQIKEESIEYLLKINTNIARSDILFKAIVIFPDLISVTYDDYEQFISKAGNNKNDPVSIQLEWSIFKANPKDVFVGCINVLFETEKSFETSDKNPGDFKRASIKFSVSGSNQEWVENTFANISLFILETKQAGIYKPLWVFRNKLFLQILSQFIGFCAFIVGFQLINRLFVVDDRMIIINNILSIDDISKKIDQFAFDVLNPISSPWWSIIIAFLGSMLLWAILYCLCLVCLPKLTPRSYIAIGLITNRARRYKNVFKFLIFNVLILAIIIPIILNTIL